MEEVVKKDTPELPGDVWYYLLLTHLTPKIKKEFFIIKNIYRVNKLFNKYFKFILSNLDDYCIYNDRDQITLHEDNIGDLYRVLRNNYLVSYFSSLGGYILHGKQCDASLDYYIYYEFEFGKLVYIRDQLIKIPNTDSLWLSESDEIHDFIIQSIEFRIYPEFKYEIRDINQRILLRITPEHVKIWKERNNGEKANDPGVYHLKVEKPEFYQKIYNENIGRYGSLRKWFKS